ncbi:MAG: UDP-N-acetylmuramoyl-L-alanyl-D-glutamate--2,6-diaminopimelate ligase [Ignavibacteria bacterium]|nr:UDP-N-acetylmuramoyl-L-alanyl-D-glutamate--2,6-diaminopimelate ligase [Ignavibacteria bacterium]
MELTKLINSLHVIHVSGNVERKDITGIYYDSRRVKRGCMFVAVKGTAVDGHRYIMEAINQGAIAVIIEDDSVVPDYIFSHENITKILVKSSRRALAEVSHFYCKEPSLKLHLTGITGTNGKTTTTWIIKFVLEKSGRKCGMVGTIANFIGNREIPSQLTTPESSDLNELLLEMVQEQCTNAIMEVSSHSLALDRVYGLNYRTAIFSNLTQDHLDFHGNFENYFASKKKLFDALTESSFAVVNIDDPYGRQITSDCKAKIYTYGQNADADFRMSNVQFDLNGTRFTLTYSGKDYIIHAPLIGLFNAYNITAAIVACYTEGLSLEEICSALTELPHVPGRFEVVNGDKCKVVVDYSHTPDSLEKALLNIRDLVSGDQEIITVFGCGGNRDRGKRPLMGKIAADLSTRVYVTSDNPRKEDPMAIIEDIIAGMQGSKYTVIADREQAIRQAIESAHSGAVILIAGKGHEDYQILGETKIHFSDKEIAMKYLEQIAK